MHTHGLMKVDNLRRAWIASFAVVVSAVFPPAAHGDEAADRKAEAQRLFAEGQAAFDNKDNATGCRLMRKSMELFAVANALFNVAQCDEREGNIASALAHWKRGMSLIDSTDKRAPIVKKAIEDLEVRVPRMRIVVDAKYEPLDVLLDDEVVSKDNLATAMFVEPGSHVVTFRKNGHEDQRVQVLLNERERTEVVAKVGAEIVVPEPKPTAIPSVTVTAPPPPPPPPKMSPLKIGGFAAVGVGAAGLLGAAITGGLIQSRHSAIENACREKHCTEEGLSLIDSQETLLPLNATLWGVGIAGGATGAILLLLSSTKAQEGRTTILTPVVSHDRFGIGLSGRF